MKTGSSWYSERIEQEITPRPLGPLGPAGAGLPDRRRRRRGDRADAARRRALAADRGGADQGLFLRQPRGPRLRRARRGRSSTAARSSTASRSASRARWCRRSAPTAASEVEVIAAGASLGAFMAMAVICRYPWLFRAAVGMSGSYDLERAVRVQGHRRLLLRDADELRAEPRRGRCSTRCAGAS